MRWAHFKKKEKRHDIKTVRIAAGFIMFQEQQILAICTNNEGLKGLSQSKTQAFSFLATF